MVSNRLMTTSAAALLALCMNVLGAPASPAVTPATPKGPEAKATPAKAPPPTANPVADAEKPTVQLKPGEAPVAVFDNVIYDAGKVRSGTVITHEFWFSNKGTGLLEILGVHPGCGCTKAGEHTRIVKPGETGKIPIRVSTMNTGGIISKAVTIKTNSPTTPELVLQVKAELWQAISMVPPNVLYNHLTSADKGDSLVKTVAIHNNLEQPIKLASMGASDPHIKAEVQELKPGKEFLVTLRLLPPLPAGPLNASVDLATGISDPQRLTVPITAYMIPDVDVSPSILTLLPGRRASMQKQLYVRSATERPLKVTSASCSAKSILASIKEVEPGKAFTVTLDIPLEYKSPVGGDRVTIQTDNPNSSTLTVVINESYPQIPSNRNASMMSLSDYQKVQQVQSAAKGQRMIQNQLTPGPTSRPAEPGKNGK